ncbi:helix-turn-helix domain-containing protein [Rhodovibrio salinarum]|nr:helix-turn-helix domain-containing protein [Rhodovibrio salinarum]
MSGTGSHTPTDPRAHTGSWHPDRLDRSPLLRACEATARAAFVKSLRCHNVQKNELIVAEGTPSTYVHMIVDGCLMVWKQRADRNLQVTGFLFPGDLLGALAGVHYLYSARAVTRSTLASVRQTELNELSDTYPNLRHALYRTVTSEFALAQDQLLILGAMNAAERVATALLQFDRRQRARGMDADAPLWLPMRRTDLASYLALELPTLSRAFSRLRQDGIIACPSTTEVALRDRKALERMSCEAPI